MLNVYFLLNNNIISGLTLLLTGLSAGLFLAWTVSVIPGTKHISTKSYLEAMQSINKAILNPAFFIIFFGAAILLSMQSIGQYIQKVDASFWLLLCATGLYVLGTLGITLWGNVPLNEMLDAKPLQKLDPEELEQIRHSFENRWNLLHTIRTFCAVSSFISLLWVSLNATM